MNKRIFSLVLALMLALASLTVAFAATESPTIDTVTKVTVAGVVSATGAALPADLIVDAKEETPATIATASTISAALASGNLAAVVGDDAVAAINQAILGKASITSLKVEEVFPLSVVNWADSYGDIIVTLDLPADYASDAVIVALVSYYNANGQLVWVVADSAIVNGQLCLTISAADLAVTGEFTVALLGA